MAKGWAGLIWWALGLAGVVPVALAQSIPAIELPTDRLIVRLRDSADASADPAAIRARGPLAVVRVRALSAYAGEALVAYRAMGGGAHVLLLSGKLSVHDVERIAARLKKHPDVLDAVPDRFVLPQFTPNDARFAEQWNLGTTNGINAPLAWDITTGSAAVVVAVLDTGILPHVDLAGRTLPGYDFVNAARSNDGGGRDANATDPGDWVTSVEANTSGGPFAGCPVQSSSWHGTAIAGVIGAASNNGAGIAGINWTSKILPVRVIGKCGGFTSDVVDGIRWAAGAPVPGVPDNSTPAKVINLSIAAAGACDGIWQGAIDDAVARNSTVISAAGNQGQDASQFSPASCNNVVTVAAVDRNGGRPAYSNTGANVTLAAPGGAGSGAVGVLATLDSGTTLATGDNLYTGVQGTSIAAAHVSGIASLMLSVAPGLTPAQVKSTLQASFRPFPTNTVSLGSGADCTQALCGLGIADAQAAVVASASFTRTPGLIALGSSSALGVAVDGKVSSWDYVASPLAGEIGELSEIVDASAQNHRLFVRRDGSVWASGYNFSGEVGDGTREPRLSPVKLTTIGGVKRVAAGEGYSLALRHDGTVWAWGDNLPDALGTGGTSDNTRPAQVVGLASVTALVADGHSLALKADGTVWAWGFNGNGQLGIGNTVTSSVPVQIPGLSNVVAVAAGSQFSLALKSDGSVWSWGGGYGGVLGDGTFPDRASPAPISALSSVVAIAAGSVHAVALKSDGSVWTWGSNYSGQLGPNLPSQSALPVKVIGVSGVRVVSAGSNSSGALRQDGSVSVWGDTLPGLSPSTGAGAEVPRLVQRGSPLVALKLGVADPAAFAVASDVAPGALAISNAITVTSGGALSVSGGEYRINGGAFTSAAGTAGSGDVIEVRRAAPASSGATASAALTIGSSTLIFQVGALEFDTLPAPFVLQQQGGVAAGVLATSNAITVTGINAPTEVSVSPGAQYSIDNGVWTAAPGTVTQGQTVRVRVPASTTPDAYSSATLTIGVRTSTFTVITQNPAKVSNAMVSVGAQHVLALAADGTVWAWGNNAYGQLGDGTATNRALPVKVTGLSGVRQVLAIGGDSFAVRWDGTVWAWGYAVTTREDDAGQPRQLQPRRVLAGAGSVAQIASEGARLWLLKTNGTVMFWDGVWLQANGLFGAANWVADLDSPAWEVGDLPPNIAGVYAVKGQLAVVDASGAVYMFYYADSQFFGATLYPALQGAQQLSRDSVYVITGTVGGNVLGAPHNPHAAAVTLYDQPEAILGHVRGGLDASYSSDSFRLLLLADGRVLATGKNQFGQLGDGTTTDVSGLVPVAGVSGAVAIAASDYGTATERIGNNSPVGVAIRRNGSVVAWGDNPHGMRGNGTTATAIGATAVLSADGAALLKLFDSITAFLPVDDALPGTQVVSNAIVITGMGSGIAVNASAGEYRINGGSFTSSSGVVSNGDRIEIRRTAPATYATQSMTTLTVGAAAFPFQITTVTADAVPFEFTFLPEANVNPNAQVVSNEIIVAGTNAPTPISMIGGEYRIDGGAWVSAAGLVNPGQSVEVRETASASYDSFGSASLSIGGKTGTFSLLTRPAPGFSAAQRIVPRGAVVLALRSDGTVWAWGSTYDRRYGLGYEPFSVPHTASGSGGLDPIEATVTTLGDHAPQMYRIESLSGVADIANGESFAVVARSDGSAWAWGDNGSGQLGDGTTNYRGLPVQVQGISGVARVAAKYPDAYALKTDGTVWSWGGGTTTPPKAFAGLTGVAALSAGSSHVLALKSDGTVWAWGDNSSGQLGNGTTTANAVPVQVTGLSGVRMVSAGPAHSVVLKADGTVWVWGSNAGGKLGDGTTNGRLIPVQVAGLASIAAVAAGYDHTLALAANGVVFGWGKNLGGEVGDGTLLERHLPVAMPGLAGVTSIAAGGGVGASIFGGLSFGVTADGTVFSWGSGLFGELGDATASLRKFAPGYVLNAEVDGPFSLLHSDTTPSRFAFLTRFGVPASTLTQSNPVTISGLGVAAAISVAGGEYRINGGAFISTPSTVNNGDVIEVRTTSSSAGGGTAVVDLTVGTFTESFVVTTRRSAGAQTAQGRLGAGEYHSGVLKLDGKVWNWGYNGNGQLGNGTSVSTPTPVAAAGLDEAVQLSVGAYHALALRADGLVLSWGANGAGQLGANTGAFGRPRPVVVAGISAVVEVAAGRYHSLALKTDGSVWAWGMNASGQLGEGTTTQRYAPVAVTAMSGVTALAAGGRHSLAIAAGGTVWAWGDNSRGQLGIGSNAGQATPVQLPNLAGIVAIAAGEMHSLAVKSDGTVFAWGANTDGQLGNGTFVDQNTPRIAINGGAGAIAVSAGASHSLAMTAAGDVLAWGLNTNGQLGDGSTASRNTPFTVLNMSQAIGIAAGGKHSMAMRADGSLAIWGDNFFGQAGNRSGNYAAFSALLNVLRGDVETVILAASSLSSVGGSSSAGGTGSFNINSLLAALDFGAHQIGGTPLQQTVVYRNLSTTDALTGVSVSKNGPGEISISHNCPPMLAPGAACNITVNFIPAAALVYSAELQVTSSAIGSPVRYSVYGQGTPPPAPGVTLGLASIAFGNQTVGMASAPQGLTLTNPGNASLAISNIAATGDFAQTNNCGASLGVLASCTINITFTPAATGVRSGTLTITHNAAGSPGTVNLSGSGITSGAQPGVPADFRAAPVSSSQINLRWTAASVGVTQYRIYRGGTLLTTLAGAPPVTGHSDTGLSASTNYSYTVQACNAVAGCSAQSAALSTSTLSAGMLGYTPELESGFNLSGNSLNVTLNVAALFGNQNSAVAGVTENIVSVWKWNAASGRWAFHSPQLTVSANASYAASHNYDLLTAINAGEGYWVNAISPVTLPLQSGTGFSWNAGNFGTLPLDFNLIATANGYTPSQFHAQVSETPPAFVSLWVWDAVAGKWYFYSPLLESSGGLPAVKAYADSHNYLHFQDFGKTLGVGTGFWVNRP